MTPTDIYDSKLNYLSYNDLGNLMGRLAQQLGMRYGQNGLYYNHIYNDSVIGRLIITKDLPEIFNILDLDYEKYLKGFNSLEEIFKLIVDSKYYSYSCFQYENLNHLNTSRNKKRKNHNLFLEYIEDYKIENDILDKYKFRKNIYKKYSGLREQEAKLNYLKSKKEYVSSKLNGRHLIEHFDISGKDISLKMTEFKYHRKRVICTPYNKERKHLYITYNENN